MADSDLTTRARAVLADIDGAAMSALQSARRHLARSGGWPCFPMNRRGREALGAMAVESGASEAMLTDLGREVARLLAEGGA